ncbi:hypothetical protein LQW54_003618 [Pestalotiopsis sp. IQ-011]
MQPNYNNNITANMPPVQPTMPAPPEGGPFGGPPCKTVEELMDSLNKFAGAWGYALVRRNAAVSAANAIVIDDNSD